MALAVLGLACWRLTNLVQQERGPFAILTQMRRLVGVEHDDEGEPTSWPDTEVGRLLKCPWCGSIWIAAGLVGFYLAFPTQTIAAAFLFALSTVAIAFQEVIHG
ncbi:MAG: DUF1360 domain-containing protein [Dehalococcoidia bacterium]|nr:DUF1360 domain-containing protein [Dehalococcoidia bacterium]